MINHTAEGGGATKLTASANRYAPRLRAAPGARIT